MTVRLVYLSEWRLWRHVLNIRASHLWLRHRISHRVACSQRVDHLSALEKQPSQLCIVDSTSALIELPKDISELVFWHRWTAEQYQSVA